MAELKVKIKEQERIDAENGDNVKNRARETVEATVRGYNETSRYGAHGAYGYGSGSTYAGHPGYEYY
ncbi:unnamed protein product [Caenorhabditis sp. 36 PRJEB53466]|nr:unnamed protein product [Caenorhabditis sp. 36 PRJEB53466]